MNCKCILFHMLVSLYLQENTCLSLTFCNLSDIENNSNNNNIKTNKNTVAVFTWCKGRTIRKVMGGEGGGGEFSSRKNFFPLSSSLNEFFLGLRMNIL